MRTIELYKQHFVTKIMYKKKTIVLKYWPGKQKGVGSNPIKTVFFFLTFRSFFTFRSLGRRNRRAADGFSGR